MSESFGIDVAEADKQLHPIFKTDPLQLFQFVNKKVSLNTLEGLVYEGWVYTIDPVTHTWVLMNPDGEGPELQLVMNRAVTKTQVVEDNSPENVLLMFKNYEKPKKVEVGYDELVKRKDAVCRWFTINRIPVVKDEEIISVANGVVSIEPPYDEESCYSSNEIILARVRTLLTTMPASCDDDDI
ncbi:gem-associated protein 6-like [Watersipora subatra]|uniref:gem-associated protein 6-like n=1 Tax=Watersipora subatra TaxID=2589382 RepID=UPI00355B4DDE